MKKLVTFSLVGIVFIFIWHKTLLYFEQKTNVEKGGFSSIEEMNVLHRLGYASRIEYDEEMASIAESERIDGQERFQEAEKRQADEQRMADAGQALQDRILNLPTYISISSSREDFKFACGEAVTIEKHAVIKGANRNFFKRNAVKEMVIADRTTLDTGAISVPVRWDDEMQLCKAWFSIDGIYNGVRYRDYYYGFVGGLRKGDEKNIVVSEFSDGFWSILSND